MNRILIPTDFSREAENALQTAIPIAKAFSAKLIILHILEMSGSISAENRRNSFYSAQVHRRRTHRPVFLRTFLR